MKQIGHSAASLYKNTSCRCPLTYGSFGSCISCGVRSCWELFRDVLVRAAKVFARPRKKGDEDEDCGKLIGDVGDGREKAGCEGERFEFSELKDGDREEMGTVRRLMFMSDERGLASFGSSGGVSSGGGMGSPLAAEVI
jgi:hypothetical protein